MENNLSINVKKSAVSANNDFEYCQITQQNEFLIHCDVNRNEDEIEYVFSVEDLLKLEELKSYSIAFRYQFLINLILLKPVANKLSFSLHPENLYFNMNMMPKVLMRDIYKESKFDDETFHKAYKSLVGYLLNDKYKYEDYYKGGEKLLGKSKFTSAFCELHTSEEINKTLIKEFKEYEDENKEKKVEIQKSKFRNLVYFRRVGVISVVVLAILCGYFAMFIVPENAKVIRGNEGFIKQDYISTMEALADINIDRMSANTKYIYAISYIKSDALSDEQKNNILGSVTVNSNTKILDYWVHLSKKQHENAIDLAKQLGNKEYLLYAYMKQKTYVEADGSLSGSEREDKTKQIESSIDTLIKEGVKDPNQATDKDVKEGK